MNVIVANKYKDMLMSLDIDVIKSIEGEYEVNELINMFTNFYFERMILDITAIKDYGNITNLQKLSINLDMSKIILILDDSAESESSSYLSQLISMGIYNFTRNLDGIKYLLANPNSYRDVAHIHQLQELTTAVEDKINNESVKVLGIKNVTEHAGATSLIYMLKKQLQSNYQVAAIEVDKMDFIYFNDKDMISTSKADLAKELMKRVSYDVILIDLNNYEDESICGDVLYLIEPTTIRLNKLMLRDRHIFEKLQGKKIVLNKSLLDNQDLMDFEYEAKTQVFYNLPPMDERQTTNTPINKLLTKLGFVKQYEPEVEEEKNSILGLFKK